MFLIGKVSNQYHEFYSTKISRVNCSTNKLKRMIIITTTVNQVPTNALINTRLVSMHLFGRSSRGCTYPQHHLFHFDLLLLQSPYRIFSYLKETCRLKAGTQC